jgi:hypothetical protein
LPEDVNRGIPKDLKVILDKLEQGGLVELYVGSYDKAEDNFREQLLLIREYQTKIGRPISKGGPLYNLGITLLGKKRQPEAVYTIMLAYAEDTLDTASDSEDDADRLPAGRILRDSFVVKLSLLRDIKAESRRRKFEGKWVETPDPQEVLEKAIGIHGSQDAVRFVEHQHLHLGAQPFGFPQPREQRVFIGTNYDTHAMIIPEIKRAVILKGYIPVIVAEVSFQAQQTRDVSLLLLHTCGSAIFDVTSPAGQLMEIERTLDYGTKVLLLRSEPIGHPPHISAMITSLGYTTQTYHDMIELRSHVANFLS